MPTWKLTLEYAGTLDAAGVQTLLERKSRDPAKWTAPPSGLSLEKVTYVR